MSRHKFLPGDEIWLVPKTLGCPSICFKQPHGVVVFGGPSPYVTVRLDGEGANTREMHENNVVRKLPTPPAEPRPPAPRKPLNLPEGMKEVTLW